MIFSLPPATPKPSTILKSIRKDLAVELKMEVQNLNFWIGTGKSPPSRSEFIELWGTNWGNVVEKWPVWIYKLKPFQPGSIDLPMIYRRWIRWLPKRKRLEHDLQVTQQAQIDLSSSLQAVMKGGRCSTQGNARFPPGTVEGAQQTVAEFEEKRNTILSKLNH